MVGRKNQGGCGRLGVCPGTVIGMGEPPGILTKQVSQEPGQPTGSIIMTRSSGKWWEIVQEMLSEGMATGDTVTYLCVFRIKRNENIIFHGKRRSGYNIAFKRYFASN